MAKVEDQLRDLAIDHGGFFTSRDAARAGISPQLVVQLAARSRIERVAHGLYRFPSWPQTAGQQYHEALLWVQAQRKPIWAVVSHESALELYGLTNLNPGAIHVTIPRGTRIVRSMPRWIRIHRGHVDDDERTTEQGVPVVTLPLAIEDVAATHGADIAHRAVSEARERHLLREDEVARLVARFGNSVLEPYRAE